MSFLVTTLPGWNLSRQTKLSLGVRVLLKASQLYIKMNIGSINTGWCNIQPSQRGSVESGESSRVAVKPEFMLWLRSSPAVRPYVSLRVACILWNEKEYVRIPAKLYGSIEMKQLLLLLIWCRELLFLFLCPWMWLQMWCLQLQRGQACWIVISHFHLLNNWKCRIYCFYH